LGLCFALMGGVGCAREAKQPTRDGAGVQSPDPATQASSTPSDEVPPRDGDATQSSINVEFENFVKERNACASDAECVLVSPGCPLGCGTGVRPEHAEEVSAKAAALIARAQEGGPSCTYKCAALQPRCQEGHCTAVVE